MIIFNETPDFFSNIYNIYVVQTSKDEKDDVLSIFSEENNIGSLLDNNIIKTDPIKNYNILSFRADGLEIPKRQQKFSTIYHYGQVVPKILNKLEIPNKASIVIPIDQEFTILDSVNGLSKIYNRANSIIDNKSSLNYSYFKDKNKSFISIIVEFDSDFSSYTTRINRINTSKNNTIHRYTFHDCKFLGNSSSIQFNSDNVEQLKMTIPFTFRSLTETIA